MLEEIENILKEWGPQIEKEIENSIPKKGVPGINDVVWYHIGTGGKRLRPVLAIMTGKALGCDVEKILPFAAACEVLHNWLLVHDDIQDGDEVRRGQPAVWKKYGLDHGINVGDFMSEKVYELILKSLERGVDEKTTIKLLDEIVKTSLRTAEGQAMEFELRKNNKPTEEEYIRMVVHKTAHYLTAPMVGAVVVANATQETIDKIREFGMKIGPAFQISDDLLDLTTGKGREDIGSDIREGKRSMMVVHCANNCSPEEKNQLFDILNKPRNETTKEDVLSVKNLFEKTGSMSYSQEQASKYMQESKDVISDMPDELRQLLENFAEYIVNRQR
ncbi:MAG: polyprenyl synthetase family protein [Nanoarchaeota archaeon]|nr:polyprenyl synthetase family protein [Nanoarchaeota archaeon]MBU2520524.1 polyprenyl synthetase family protein [Nanoarchaeota archaeon]